MGGQANRPDPDTRRRHRRGDSHSVHLVAQYVPGEDTQRARVTTHGRNPKAPAPDHPGQVSVGRQPERAGIRLQDDHRTEGGDREA